ncbi:hypothetical protein [Flavobacterium limnophilum]|nr:hypothetical protein [Flavobacterium limnophilum]
MSKETRGEINNIEIFGDGVMVFLEKNRCELKELNRNNSVK